MRLLVTGGAGFIGSNFIRWYLAEHPNDQVINVDLLTYAGNLENLREVEKNPAYSFVRADINDRQGMGEVFARGVDAVINFAAESHVDRSIESPQAFINTNVHGTLTLLLLALEYGVKRFLQVSTDEVYGSLDPEDSAFTEKSPLAPSSPYAASKAGADLLVGAFYRTYGLPVLITRCTNNYGPYQFPEKLIPLMIINALEDRALPVYGDGRQVRDWIFVTDHCRALAAVLQRGRPGEVYNIGGDCERTNLMVVREILKILGKPETLIRFVEDRPGHDRRYAVKNTKIKTLGWTPQVDFVTGLARTVRWYLENREWCQRVTSGEYREYYRRMYSRRLEKKAGD